MTDFEENYPELKGHVLEGRLDWSDDWDDGEWVRKERIAEHCLSRQKVKQAIEKSLGRWDFTYRVTNEEVISHLLKELGLMDE